jgi:hypothetical protein
MDRSYWAKGIVDGSCVDLDMLDLDRAVSDE